MKRFMFALTLCLTLCLIYSLSKAQDAPLWKYIASTKNEQTGEVTSFHARDCYRFTDAESEKYPKLAIRASGGEVTEFDVKETVVEYDCKRRAARTRIYIDHIDGKERKKTELDWTEVVPNSAREALLNYACRDRSKEKK